MNQITPKPFSKSGPFTVQPPPGRTNIQWKLSAFEFHGTSGLNRTVLKFFYSSSSGSWTTPDGKATISGNTITMEDGQTSTLSGGTGLVAGGGGDDVLFGGGDVIYGGAENDFISNGFSLTGTSYN